MPCRFGEATLTVTPGSASPCVSFTWPEIVPVVLCAFARPADMAVANANSSAMFLNRIESLPGRLRIHRSMKAAFRHSSQLEQTRPNSFTSIQIFVPTICGWSQIRDRVVAIDSRGRSRAMRNGWLGKSPQEVGGQIVEMIDHQIGVLEF